MSTARILVVDDEPTVRQNIAEAFAERGHEVAVAPSAKQARQCIRQENPDLLLLDRKLPDADGVELLGDLRRSGFHSPVIIITGHGTIANAAEALKQSAYDYIAKPFVVDELLDKADRALSGARRMDDNAFLRRALRKRFRFDTVLSLNPATQECYLLATKAAPTDARELDRHPMASHVGAVD